MTRTLGLDLIETALITHPPLLFRHDEFTFLLKEQVCALVIKIFSPSVKHASKTPVLLFPVVVRLLHVLMVLVLNYHALM
jgi:hypothetical protein